MRTTLTLDDDIEKELRDSARRDGRALKEVVNETLRRGLNARRFQVNPKACGFRTGIDPAQLNQLLDELEIDR
jgi:hypothetical protein